MVLLSDRARSFGRVADDDDRLRPGYPPEALRPVVGDLVVDVGAGTGKLTSALTSSRRRVVAVEPEAAAVEARRVLVDDGTLLLLWNMPDLGVAWVRELNRLAGQPVDIPDLTPMELVGFSAGEVQRTPWEQSLTADDLVQLFSTFSRVSTREPEDRDRVLASIRASLTGRTVVSYPYICVSVMYRRA